MTQAKADHPRRALDDDSTLAIRWLIAALSFGAGAIHLAMVPQHAQEALGVGLAFAAAGWFQIAFGAAMIARPKRIWVQIALFANIAFIATWVLSRTAGLPTWTGDGGVEPASTIDVLCVAFEVGIVLAAAALLVTPNAVKSRTRPALVGAAIVAVGILVATTAALAAPSTANHVHADGEGEVAEGHTHTGDAATAAETARHDHADSTITYDKLPRATKAEVDQVMAVWANKYATGADAIRDGWIKATRNLYGIGAHYVRGTSLAFTTTFDMMNPNILLFDGDGPDAKFAGVSYIVQGHPEGFTGDYDPWHAHSSVCFKGGTIVSLTEDNSEIWLSENECIARGGRLLPLSSAEMLHLWIGPEYIDAPIFAHDHPKLLDGFDPQKEA